jgi:uncharacterized membrane protein YcaP (DUF421 family)
MLPTNLVVKLRSFQSLSNEGKSIMLNSWTALLHTVVIGSLSYIVLVALLRISGKRTLSKWNAFDFIVTIAFGSILGMMLLSRETSLIQGALGFGVLVVLQFIINWLSVHFPEFKGWIKSQPVLLLYKGELQHNTLRRERVTEGEVRAALRANGIANLENVEAVVLETNGSFSVIEQAETDSASALLDVKGYPHPQPAQPATTV